MAIPAHPDSLSDDDYSWLMSNAKVNGPEDPDERERYLDLATRLRLLTPEHQWQERTAYHEAAHAVVAHYVGFSVPHLLIRDDHSGEAKYSEPMNAKPSAEEAVQALLDSATISAAGYVAEEIKWRYARLPEQNLVSGIVMQLREVYVLADSLPEDRRRELFSFAIGRHLIGAGVAVSELGEAEARSILRAHWASVQLLAETVLARRHVDGEALATILESVQRRS